MQRVFLRLAPCMRLSCGTFQCGFDSAIEALPGAPCRGLCQKPVIRWPKNPPGKRSRTTTNQSIEREGLGIRKTEGIPLSFNQSFPRSQTHGLGVNAEGGRIAGENGFDDEQPEDLEESSIERSFPDEADEESNITLHFDKDDVGFTDTRIISGERLADRTASKSSRLRKQTKKHESSYADLERVDYGHAEPDSLIGSDPSKGSRDDCLRQSVDSADASEVSPPENSPGEATTNEMEATEVQNDAPHSPRTLHVHQGKSKKSDRYFKSRTSPHNEILYGISPCQLALLQERRVVHKAYVLEAFKNSARTEAKDIGQMLTNRGVAVHETSRGRLNGLSNGRPHQGVCLEVSPLHLESLKKISGELLAVPQDSRPLILALDKILDPMNLGALMRSAYFLGVDWVIASKKNCCPLTATVSKASSGVAEVMPVYAARTMEDLLKELSSHEWQIIGATNRGGLSDESKKPLLSCNDVRVTRPTVLVIGSEGFGLRPSLEAYCDTLVTVSPGRALHRNIDSLNVSVATGSNGDSSDWLSPLAGVAAAAGNISTISLSDRSVTWYKYLLSPN